jgi:methyl-accepting chemotaxis protein
MIADKTADALSNIVAGVEKAAELVAQIAIASNRQVAGISQINSSIDQMMHVVQTNSATSEETAAASEELSSQAEVLRDMVAKFELKVKKLSEEDSTLIQQARDERFVLEEKDYGKY